MKDGLRRGPSDQTPRGPNEIDVDRGIGSGESVGMIPTMEEPELENLEDKARRQLTKMVNDGICIIEFDEHAKGLVERMAVAGHGRDDVVTTAIPRDWTAMPRREAERKYQRNGDHLGEAVCENNVFGLDVCSHSCGGRYCKHIAITQDDPAVSVGKLPACTDEPGKGEGYDHTTLGGKPPEAGQ